jgi:hypothetical protein
MLAVLLQMALVYTPFLQSLFTRARAGDVGHLPAGRGSLFIVEKPACSSSPLFSSASAPVKRRGSGLTGQNDSG